MRGLAVVVTGLCVGAYACGGSSGAFVATTADSGADGTTPVGGDDAAPSPGPGDDSGTGMPARGMDASPAADGPSPPNPPAEGDGGSPTTEGGSPTGADGGPVDSGAAPDAPAGLSCGSATCSTAQFCCAELDGGAACMTSEQACATAGGVPRRCEKTSDCPANNLCCFDFSSFPATTSCHNDCSGGGGTRVEACRSQSDCTAGTCAVHACIDGGAIQSCASFGTECP